MRFARSPRGSAPTLRSPPTRRPTSTSDGQGRVPAMLRFVQQDASYQGPRSTDPEFLRQVAAPVLLLRGQQTKLGTFAADAARHIAQHVSDPHVRELPDAGHFAPVLAPQALAKE